MISPAVSIFFLITIGRGTMIFDPLAINTHVNNTVSRYSSISSVPAVPSFEMTAHSSSLLKFSTSSDLFTSSSSRSSSNSNSNSNSNSSFSFSFSPLSTTESSTTFISSLSSQSVSTSSSISFSSTQESSSLSSISKTTVFTSLPSKVISSLTSSEEYSFTSLTWSSHSKFSFVTSESSSFTLTSSLTTVTSIIDGETIVSNMYTTITYSATTRAASKVNNHHGGISSHNKNILIGCVVGIGIPLLIAIAFAFYIFCIRSKKQDFIDSEGRMVTSYKQNPFAKWWYSLIGKNDINEKYDPTSPIGTTSPVFEPQGTGDIKNTPIGDTSETRYNTFNTNKTYTTDTSNASNASNASKTKVRNSESGNPTLRYSTYSNTRTSTANTHELLAEEEQFYDNELNMDGPGNMRYY